MSFNGLDLDEMFKDAVKASEDTGEDNVGEKTAKDSPKKAEPTPKETHKPEVKAKPEPVKAPKKEPKPEPKYVEPAVEKEPERRAPLIQKEEKLGPIRQARPSVNTDRIDADAIGRILDMDKILNEYSTDELNFVQGYLNVDNGDYANIIHKALITSRRDLEALDEIVEARSKDYAERAFYLMELDPVTIRNVYNQIDIIVGGLEHIDSVTDSNKINICRTIEKHISNMDKNQFSLINKLQIFTNKATQ